MINKIVIKLICKKLKLKKFQRFRFAEQKSNAVYYFSDTQVIKVYRGKESESNVSLNHLLNNACRIFAATPKQIRVAQTKEMKRHY